MKYNLAAIFVVTFLFIWLSSSSFACSCKHPNSDIVFIGKVKEIKELDENSNSILIGNYRIISATFKWDAQTTFEIRTPNQKQACGFQFELEKDYIIYATNQEGILNTTSCHQTGFLSQINSEQCELIGGNWGTSGLYEIEECNYPTRDVGKECRNSSECESACIYIAGENKEKGKCFDHSMTRGTCLNYFEDGKIQVGLCVD